MEMVHKIRRKSDGMFWDRDEAWDEKGHIFKTTQNLVSYILSNLKTFCSPEDIEVISYTIEPHSAKDLTEWADYNTAFCNRMRSVTGKAGRFLYAILASNLTKKNLDKKFEFKNEDGWFSVEEIVSKTSMSTTLVRNIASSYKVRSATSSRPILKKAFWVNGDYSQIRFSPIAEERLEIPVVK